MEILKTGGERLGKYELEKRHAIEMEDYERAETKKKLIEDLRSSIYLEGNVEQLLERNGV